MTRSIRLVQSDTSNQLMTALEPSSLSNDRVEALTPELRSLFACALPRLGDWVPVRKLQSGGKGGIYEACDLNSCDYVVKVQTTRFGFIRNNADRRARGIPTESQVAELASEIGVGPKVYRSIVCDRDATEYEFIVMQRLAGPTLYNAYPYRAQDIKHAMDLLLRLMQSGVQQHDVHGGNFVFNRTGRIGDDHPDRKLFMIDFGNTGFVDRKHITKIQLQDMSDELFRSLIGGAPRPWAHDPDWEQRVQVLIAVTSALHEWLTDHFAASAFRLPKWDGTDSERLANDPGWTKWLRLMDAY